MNSHDTYGPDEQKNQAILQAYGVLTALHALDTHRTPQAERPVLINDLLDYVKGRSTHATPRVEQAIASNLTVRRQYKQLLSRQPIGHIAKPRAASNEAMFDQRIGEHGVRLQLKQSKGHPDQYYLILELPEAFPITHGKPLVLHANTEHQTQRAVFPPAHDHRSQIILHADDALFSLLQDHDVEIDIQ